MPIVAGIDSSTQSTKIVVCDALSGRVLREARAAHPDGTEAPPSAWRRALAEASSGGLLDGVQAVAVAGQQHGMVVVDQAGGVVRPALLWNDTRSAGAADDLVAELGGPAVWADAVGSVPVAAFTVTKLRWFARAEPEEAARATAVMLPHDWLTWQLTGSANGPSTDRGDASGTGYYSAATGQYRPDLLVHAFGRSLVVPRVLAPDEPAGTTPEGILVAAGTGDNMGAALGLDLRPGDVVVSLGTSGTAFAVHDAPTADPSGEVAGFADATGRFLPLVCTLNAARVLTATAAMLGVDSAGFDRLALDSSPGARGLVLLPYLDGERTPNLPDAAGTLSGLRRDTMTPANLARAAVEGMLCGLADGVDALIAQGVTVNRVLLIGGAARSEAVRLIAPAVFGVPVLVPEPGEYVALGAARQAAWALAASTASGRVAGPPDWSGSLSAREAPLVKPQIGAAVRAAYAEARQRAYPSTR